MPSLNDNFVEKRRERRTRTVLAARAVFNDRFSTMDCRVRDIAAHGARLRFGGLPMLPHHFELRISDRDEKRQVRRIWTDGRDMGVAFL